MRDALAAPNRQHSMPKKTKTSSKRNAAARSSLARGFGTTTRRNFSTFGAEIFREVTERCAAGEISQEDEMLLEKAATHGLVQHVKYGPTIHGSGVDAEKGDWIWWWGSLPND